jgi:Raf kinase inhibitor-like YbhB/YbcL family protein
MRQLRKIRIISTTVTILLLASLLIYLFYFIPQEPPDQKAFSMNKNNKNSHMKISSPAFENNAGIPSKFTCDGENISPTLNISEMPNEAKSLVLIVDDPDAPVAEGFVHWILFNINPTTTEIEENGTPAEAIQGQNSLGESRYTGPCPPSGNHHYHFRIYALNSPLNLSSSAKREDIERSMKGHILDEAEIVGLYQRQQRKKIETFLF